MRTVIKALIYCQDQLLVLTRSSSHPKYPYAMDLPGGIVESEEDSIAALRREVKEETGIDLKGYRLDKAYLKPQANDWAHIVYRANTNSPRPKVSLSWEHQAYDWLTLPELLKKIQPKVIDPFFFEVLEYLRFTVGEKV